MSKYNVKYEVGRINLKIKKNVLFKRRKIKNNLKSSSTNSKNVDQNSIRSLPPINKFKKIIIMIINEKCSYEGCV